MSEPRRSVTPQEIETLGNTFGLQVDASTTETLADDVTDRLADDLDSIYDVPVHAAHTATGDRRWWEPNDPFNAISVNCDVPPQTTDGILSGRSIGLKDIIAVGGVPMRCGSPLMLGYVPTADATVSTRLLSAGATITAKTNLDEFAGGGRGKSFRGMILNPIDDERIAGGSSGGSAAAVAAGLVDCALGTDTGGSIRKPAAFCELVGLKPTYGLVPLTGVAENTYSIDHVGPMTTTVADAAAVLEAIAGPDDIDPASMIAGPNNGGYIEAVSARPEPSDLRIGVATQCETDPMDDIVRRVHEAAIATLESAGVTVVSIELPYLDQTKAVKNTISYVELAAYWRDGGLPIRRGGLASPTDAVAFTRHARSANHELNEFYRGRIFTGARILDAHHGRHYAQALGAKRTIRDAFSESVADVDAMITPTVPGLAPRLEQITDPDFDYDGLDEDAVDYGRYTKLANLTGGPAITVPNRLEDGTGVGLQLLADRFQDAEVLGVAATVEGLISSG